MSSGLGARGTLKRTGSSCTSCGGRRSGHATDLRRIAVKLGRTLLAVMSATVLIGSLATTASARSFSLSDQRFRVTFASFEVSGLFGTAFRCTLTLEGSLHARTLAKTVNSLLGYITRAARGACSSGTSTILTETLPWHIQYRGFAGMLPSIATAVTNIINMAYRIRETGGITCLVRTAAAEPGKLTLVREGRGGLISGSLEGSIRTGAECFGAAIGFAGSSNSLVNETGSAITMTLI